MKVCIFREAEERADEELSSSYARCPKKRFSLTSGISDKVLSYAPTFAAGPSTSRAPRDHVA